MEEIEVPLEQVQENAHHALHHESSARWINGAALASALTAVVAATAALLAGQHANEAMIGQIKASNQWNYYQAKGVKSAVLASKVELLREMGHTAEENSKDTEKLEAYKKDQESISESAKEFEKESEHHLKVHEIIARAVTMFQVAIALGAVAILSRRKRFWFASLGLSAVGILFFIQGLLT